jgi:DNA repair protein RadA/Sms
MSVQVLKNVVPEKIERFSTTYDEMDWAFGKKGGWGPARARITLMAGEQGVGKTRLLSQLMKRWDKVGESSMIFQGEVSAGQFASEKMEGYQSDRIWVSDDTDIYAQIEAIKKYKPAIVITDSVQQVEQFKGGRGAKEIVRELRKAINMTGTHVIFISHMTLTGSAKGGTELPHEVDVCCSLKKWAPRTAPKMFALEIGKNRYGESGKEVVFCHMDWGVDCQSENRFKDPAWTKCRTPEPRKKFLGLF